MQNLVSQIFLESSEITTAYLKINNLSMAIGVIAIFILSCAMLTNYSTRWLFFSSVVNLFMLLLFKRVSFSNFAENYNNNPAVTLFALIILALLASLFFVKIFTNFENIPFAYVLPAINIAIIGLNLYSCSYLADNQLVAFINLISVLFSKYS